MNIYVSDKQHDKVIALLNQKIGIDIPPTNWTLQLQGLLGVSLAESLLKIPGTHYLVRENSLVCDRTPVRIPTDEERTLAAFLVQTTSALQDLLTDGNDPLAKSYAQFLINKLGHTAQ